MPNIRRPRKGSMAYWPRKRARRLYSRIRCWPKTDEVKLLGFAGYKVGMTHISITDNRKNSTTKGEDITWPVTIIECPPIKIAAIQLYKHEAYGIKLANQVMVKCDKELGRKLSLPKKIDEKKKEELKAEDYSDVRVLAYTQPKLTGIGKKKPELFEIGLGGKSVEEKLNYAKEILGKVITVQDTLQEGQLLDFHGITKGKGLQGPVKRFGVKIQGRKKEKIKRGPGSLGSWKGQGHMMYRVAHAGQTGYFQRVEYNKKLIKIGDKTDEILPKGGFLHYGFVKNNYLLVKGSLQGPAKRIIRIKQALRPNKKFDFGAPEIQYISLNSKQGR